MRIGFALWKKAGMTDCRPSYPCGTLFHLTHKKIRERLYSKTFPDSNEARSAFVLTFSLKAYSL